MKRLKFYVAFIKFSLYNVFVDALVAEQVDAADLKSVDRKVVPVRFRPSAPFIKNAPLRAFFLLCKPSLRESPKLLLALLGLAHCKA